MRFYWSERFKYFHHCTLFELMYVCVCGCVWAVIRPRQSSYWQTTLSRRSWCLPSRSWPTWGDGATQVLYTHTHTPVCTFPALIIYRKIWSSSWLASFLFFIDFIVNKKKKIIYAIEHTTHHMMRCANFVDFVVWKFHNHLRNLIKAILSQQSVAQTKVLSCSCSTPTVL